MARAGSILLLALLVLFNWADDFCMSAQTESIADDVCVDADAGLPPAVEAEMCTTRARPGPTVAVDHRLELAVFAIAMTGVGSQQVFAAHTSSPVPSFAFVSLRC